MISLHLDFQFWGTKNLYVPTSTGMLNSWKWITIWKIWISGKYPLVEMPVITEKQKKNVQDKFIIMKWAFVLR